MNKNKKFGEEISTTKQANKHRNPRDLKSRLSQKKEPANWMIGHWKLSSHRSKFFLKNEGASGCLSQLTV